MSKKVIYNKHLEVGRFYVHSDGHGGHPALLYRKNDHKNKYYVLIFTSSKGSKRFKLKHSIESSKVKDSYIHKNPVVCKRRDLSSKCLIGIKIHQDDKNLIKLIKRKR